MIRDDEKKCKYYYHCQLNKTDRLPRPIDNFNEQALRRRTDSLSHRVTL